MFGNKQKILLALVCIALVFSVGTTVAASHTDDGGGEADANGNLRVVHASPDAPNVDVYVDGNAVLEDVEFGTVSDYLELPTGEHQIKVTPAGDSDTSVFNESVEVAEGNFTAIAIGEVAEGSPVPFTVEILEDDNTPTDEGMARVRAVHASPDAPAVDITVEETGNALFDNVSVGDAGYVSVPAGEYTLEVRVAQEDNQGDVVTTFNLNAEAGSVYTAFAVGYVSPGDDPGDKPFRIVTSVDAEPGVSEGDESPSTAVTFENQTSDGGSVVVAESSHDEEYVVVVHADDNGAPGDIIGSEGDLNAGVNENVTVTLDEALDPGEHTLYAMLHETSEEGEFGPPLRVNGEIVVESAQVTVEGDMDGGMGDGMGGNESEDDGMADGETDGGMQNGTDGNESEAGGDGGGGQGLPGFTALAAVAALVGAAFVLARRDTNDG